jgi:hypothetical protein
MDYSEAKHHLLLHGSGTTDAAGQPLMYDDGLLASLRPYTGLHENNFHLVMEALLSVGEHIHRSLQVDRDLIQSVWFMCSTARAWALHPGGMLQRNKLITDADATRLELWIDTIEQTALSLLGGRPPHHAVYHYAEYILTAGWWENIEFFIPLMDHAVSDPDINDAIEMVVNALGKLAGIAIAALPTLHEAERRSYTWAIPEERCTAEVRAHIRRAIQAIEGTAGQDMTLSAQDA